MTPANDNVLLTVEQIIDHFGLSAGRVRAWIAAGKLAPIRREGRGRGGTMFFARGDVTNLVYGVCLVCGGGFKKGSVSQRFCGKPCRQKFSRLQAKEQG